ncbi:MAG: carboxylesterase family protein [Woeseiaceae bacterium]|nr:carboxylesterase family protein [Woeseiaceae bacterium]
MNARLPALIAALVLAHAAAAEPLEIAGGLIKGTILPDSGIHLFRGIPFAAPPVGDRRWRAPYPVSSWDGVLQADTWGTHCMQGEMFGGPLTTRDDSMGEDCLYLNVWTPTTDPDAALPVLVVFHGGGFAAGSGSEARTDGEWYAEQGIVVVEPNYRLGLFGFMAHPALSEESGGRGSGNYGMLDQVAALRWVQDNVAAFGGNPDNVTINGESAGSMSVSALMASPLSKHMVHKAIGQSGAFFPQPARGLVSENALDTKERDGMRFAASVGAGSLAELRAMPADTLLAAVMSQDGGWGYGPGIDGYFLERPVADIYADGEQADIPLLAGWTSSELGMSVALNPEKPTLAAFKAQLSKTFGARAEEALAVYPADDDAQLLQSAADLASDLFISYVTWKWIETHASTATAPVYRYRFDRTRPDDPASRFGALHADDIEYAFNTLDSKPAGWHAADYAVADTMATAFANFILTGNPNGDGVPDWPEFDESGQVMYFDAVSRSGPEEARPRYEFLDAVVRGR